VESECSTCGGGVRGVGASLAEVRRRRGKGGVELGRGGPCGWARIVLRIYL